MYAALLLFGAGCAWASTGTAGWLLWIALAAVLAVKASLEKQWTAHAPPDYVGYQAGTKRFVPWIHQGLLR